MISVEYLGQYQLTQSDQYFKLGRDSVLLAGFCTLKPNWQVCDLGCGVGSLLLLLSQRETRLTRIGVEWEPGAAELARKKSGGQWPGRRDPHRRFPGKRPAAGGSVPSGDLKPALFSVWLR